ncbi:hypothetical protein QW131_15945 [Roseibium salinum]|nr:hypothetical protein [Roseibium salinum]
MSDGLHFNETLYPGVQVSYTCDEILYQEKNGAPGSGALFPIRSSERC